MSSPASNLPGASAAVGSLARLLADARAQRDWLDTLSNELAPPSIEHAYAVQHETLRLRGASIGGWKVGAKSPAGSIQGAPLPLDCIHRAPASLPLAGFAKAGLELEIAFRLGRRFDASATPYGDDEVQGAIVSVCATIEVVASRFANWPRVDPLWQLADLQNHGALAFGEALAYDPGYPFLAPALSFTFNGVSVVTGAPANPAGDPRRLLGWVVNHCTALGVTLPEDTLITAGSYTGVYFPEQPGLAIGTIEGLPPVQLTLS